MVAQATAAFGLRQLAAVQAQSALYWLEVARRWQPADWRYAWYVGLFWQAQAAENRDPRAVRLALEAFDAGFAANRLEVKNLLGRLATVRRFRELIDPRPRPETIDAWSAQALAMAPLNADARRERALALEQLGRTELALAVAQSWLEDEPRHAFAAALTRRLREKVVR